MTSLGVVGHAESKVTEMLLVVGIWVGHLQVPGF